MNDTQRFFHEFNNIVDMNKTMVKKFTKLAKKLSELKWSDFYDKGSKYGLEFSIDKNSIKFFYTLTSNFGGVDYTILDISISPTPTVALDGFDVCVHYTPNELNKIYKDVLRHARKVCEKNLLTRTK